MGCGASKGADAIVVVPPPQAKETENCSQCPAAPTPLPGSQAALRTDSIRKRDVCICESVSLKTGDMGDGVASPVDDTNLPSAADGLLKAPSIKTLSVMVIAEPQCLESDIVTDYPESAEASTQRPPSAEPENPARAAFRARSTATSPDDSPPSPVAFKSSRSLNRSIGVRRRANDQGSHQGSPPPPVPDPEPAQPCGSPATRNNDEEDEDGNPDTLREQFELTKESNPLLVVGRKPTGNGILSCKASEKSTKSHRRLQFALEGGVGPDRPASGGGGGAAVKSGGAAVLEDGGGGLGRKGSEAERSHCRSAWAEDPVSAKGGEL